MTSANSLVPTGVTCGSGIRNCASLLLADSLQDIAWNLDWFWGLIEMPPVPCSRLGISDAQLELETWQPGRTSAPNNGRAL